MLDLCPNKARGCNASRASKALLAREALHPLALFGHRSNITATVFSHSGAGSQRRRAPKTKEKGMEPHEETGDRNSKRTNNVVITCDTAKHVVIILHAPGASQLA